MANKKHLIDMGDNIAVIRGMTRGGTADNLCNVRLEWYELISKTAD